jgi:hypothetical protein
MLAYRLYYRRRAPAIGDAKGGDGLSCGNISWLTMVVETHTLVFNKKVDEIISMNEQKNKMLGRMHIMVGSRLLGEV